jgi:hypothetical protein
VEAERQGIELNVFRPTDYGVPYGCSPIIACKTEALGSSTLSTFMKATAQGYAWAAANPAEAADILFDAVASDIKRGAMAALPIPLDREMCRASQEYVSARYLSSEGHWGVMQQKMWDDFLDWLSENGLLTTAIQSRKEGGTSLDDLRQGKVGDTIPREKVISTQMFTNSFLQ